MNQYESNDWRSIAHDEYEVRKHIELQLARVEREVADLNKSLDATNNYNAILVKKIAELESTTATQSGKLQRSIELLKNAKLLFSKHKQQILDLETSNQNLQNEVLKKSAMLDAEKMQHERTSAQLAQALNKLATAVAMSSMHDGLLSHHNRQAPDIIYAEADPQYEQANKKSFIQKLFGNSEIEDNSVKAKDADAEFIDQVIFFEKQFNK